MVIFLKKQKPSSTDDWSIQPEYREEIFDILEENLDKLINIRESSFWEDVSQATDAVIELRPVAVRIRNTTPYEFGKIPDVTIRSSCRGAKTELDKIKSGWGEVYLYCWKNIEDYILYDIKKLRQNDFFTSLDKEEISNDDGTGFITISLPELQRYSSVIKSTVGTKSLI